MPTFDQIRGPIERLFYIALAYAAGKGWLAQSDVAGLVTLAVAVAGAFYGWWQNRPKAILQSASALPEVKKIVSTDAAQVADPNLPKVMGT